MQSWLFSIYVKLHEQKAKGENKVAEFSYTKLILVFILFLGS